MVLVQPIMGDEDSRLVAALAREQTRLKSFIGRRVRNPSDAEDVLQDVMVDFLRAYRLPEPIEQVGAWLIRVARNRIVDRFRRARASPVSQEPFDDQEAYSLGLALPAAAEGPEASLARSFVLTKLQEALGELPPDQRDVFVAHEIDGLSFKEISARTEVPLNTLLARKRYAVLHLRRRLQAVYDDLEM
jgi:RNA polymerase sigma factor (sigma-70 family)